MAIITKFKINKISKSKFEELVSSGTITPDMIRDEVWLFTDDQFVGEPDIENWNSKASISDIPTKVSQLENDSKFINESALPKNTSDLINDSNFAYTDDIPTKVSQLENDSGYLNSFTEKDPTVPSWAKQLTKPTYTKEEIGLGLVDNKSSDMILSELSKSDIVEKLGYIPLNPTVVGQSSGVASLDDTGKIPESQLPSYIDDVLEFDKLSELPRPGESGKIYIVKENNISYRWGGADYVSMASDLALGETSSTAFRGDLGKIAYDHSQEPHAPSNAQENIIEHILVNGAEQIPESKMINLKIPTKTTDLVNNSYFISDQNYVHTDNNLTNEILSDITSNTNNRHNHTNKSTLDSLTPALLEKLSSLSTVATTGNYNDLSGLPSINNRELKDNLSLDDLGIKQDYNAGDIEFSDGETLQDKYNNSTLCNTAYILDDLPIGAQFAYSSVTNIPEGCLVCNGSAVSRTDYSELFAVIGTTYGAGDGSTTFNLPDKRGRVSVGLDTTQDEFNSLGKHIGDKTHTLTINEIPKHQHNLPYYKSTWTDKVEIKTNNAQYGVYGDTSIRYAKDNNEGTYTGGGQSHNNIQPSEVDIWLIKAKQKATNQLPNATIYNGLDSTSTTNALSANMGRVLNDKFKNNMGNIIVESISSKNLFNKNDVVLDYYLSYDNGQPVHDTNMCYTNYYIEVNPGAIYTMSNNSAAQFTIHYYDANKNWLGYNNQNNNLNFYTVTIINNAKYVRLACGKIAKDSIQFEKGNVATPFSPYKIFDNTQSIGYQIGDVVITSTIENPSSRLGGTWELIDKEFKYDGGTVSDCFTANSTNVTSHDFKYVRSGHSIFMRLNIVNKVALTDTTLGLGVFDWEKLGFTSLYYGMFELLGASDGGQAIVMARIQASGEMTTTDVHNINGSHNIGAESVIYWNFTYPIHYPEMLDSACDKFYWKRIS